MSVTIHLYTFYVYGQPQRADAFLCDLRAFWLFHGKWPPRPRDDGRPIRVMVATKFTGKWPVNPWHDGHPISQSRNFEDRHIIDIVRKQGLDGMSGIEKGRDQPWFVMKMSIKGDELDSVLQGLGCAPDIIGRDRRALTFELQDQSRVAICRDPRDLFHQDCASLEKRVQLFHVLGKASSPAKPEKKLTQDQGSNHNQLCPNNRFHDSRVVSLESHIGRCP